MRSLRRVALFALKAGVVLAVLAWSFGRLSWEDRAVSDAAGSRIEPGVRSTLAGVDPLRLGGAVALVGPVIFLAGLRWHLLLSAVRAGTRWPAAVRLTFIGHFFTLVGPGGLGGDVVRGVGISAASERPPEAVATIVADRVSGLFGLLLMGAVAVLLRFEQLGGVARSIGLLLTTAVVGIALYFAPPVRRLLRVERLTAHLPAALQRLEASLYGLRTNWRALVAATGLTVVLQLILTTAIALAGRGLGFTAPHLEHYLAIVPIAYLIAALPISPGGIGLLEAAFQQLLSEAALASPSQGFMLGVLVRLMFITWTLPGLVLWLAGPPLLRRPIASRES